MAKQTLYERLKEVLRTLDDEGIFAIWNEYCLQNKYGDDQLFQMEMFDELYEGATPLDVAQRVFFGHDGEYEHSSFNPNRKYFYFNGYANPVSIDYLTYNSYRGDYLFGNFDEGSVIDWLEESENDCGIGEIAEVFSELEDDEEEGDEE